MFHFESKVQIFPNSTKLIDVPKPIFVIPALFLYLTILCCCFRWLPIDPPFGSFIVKVHQKQLVLHFFLVLAHHWDVELRQEHHLVTRFAFRILVCVIQVLLAINLDYPSRLFEQAIQMRQWFRIEYFVWVLQFRPQANHVTHLRILVDLALC